MRVLEESQGFNGAVAQSVEKGEGFSAFGPPAFWQWIAWWFWGDGVAVEQALLVPFRDGRDVGVGDVLAFVMVTVFEVESVVEDDLHALRPGLAVTFGDAVEFADVVFVADAVVAAEGEGGRPVVVDGDAGVSRQDAERGGALGATAAVAEHQGQQGGAAHVEPETLSGEAESRLIAADGLGCTQGGGDGGDERIEASRDPFLARADPAFADPPSGQDLDDVGGAFQRDEVADMQGDGETCQTRALLVGCSAPAGAAVVVVVAQPGQRLDSQRCSVTTSGSFCSSNTCLAMTSAVGVADRSGRHCEQTVTACTMVWSGLATGSRRCPG